VSGHAKWLRQWPPSGPAVFRLGRAGDDLVAEWPGFGILRADVAGERSEFTPGTSGPLHVHERLSEVVAALLRHLRGGITLHASSISYRDVALACLGETGAGKSTLAARLCASADVALLSDDTTALRLEGPHIEVDPTEGHHWLRADMALAMGIDPDGRLKVPLAAKRHGLEPVCVGAIIALAFDDAAPVPKLTRMHGAEAFSALSLATFRFALDVPHVLQLELDNLARIAREIPIYELRRCREPASMEASSPIVRRLLEQIAEGAETA
jgi:hypothetical protein